MVSRAVRGSSQADYMRELTVLCAGRRRDHDRRRLRDGDRRRPDRDGVSPRGVRDRRRRRQDAHAPAGERRRAALQASRRPATWPATPPGCGPRRRGGKAVGSVGGLDIPPVERALAGFRFGAKRAHPGLRVLTGVLRRLRGAGEMRAAGARTRSRRDRSSSSRSRARAASGVLAAARAKGIVGIGFGADQSSLGPYVLTSALERADVAVEAAVRRRPDRAAGGRHQRDLRRPQRRHHASAAGAPGWAPRSGGRSRPSSRS